MSSKGEESKDSAGDVAASNIARGVRRLLRKMGFSSVTELVLGNGRRADIVALSREGAIHIFEVKSSVEDFRADFKWREYLDHCDKFYFAVAPPFPLELIPEEVGLIIADQYDAWFYREAPSRSLKATRRRMLIVQFAKSAANKLHDLADPIEN